MNLYNAYMGVNGRDPLGLEIGRKGVLKTYRNIYEDQLLDLYLNIFGESSIEFGDVMGDMDLDGWWFANMRPHKVRIQIEEDLDSEVRGALYLRIKMLELLAHSDALADRYYPSIGVSYAGQFAEQYKGRLKAGFSVTANVADSYVSLLTVAAEPLDWVVSIGEISDGNHSAAIGMALPFLGGRMTSSLGKVTDLTFARHSLTYLKAIEKHTGFRVGSAQRKMLMDSLRANKYTRLTTKMAKKHRRKFTTSVKNTQIGLWEKHTGQIWPRYSADLYNAEGTLLRSAGQPYDAHHVIENVYGGAHEWWNLTPARFPDQHQGGIHTEDIMKVLFQ